MDSRLSFQIRYLLAEEIARIDKGVKAIILRYNLRLLKDQTNLIRH